MKIKTISSSGSIKKKHGTFLIMAAFSMLGLLGIAGLAIDVGYMMMVRNQLQDAADAAALYGANYLVHLAVNPAPDFTTAKNRAVAAFNSNIQGNTANNVVLAINSGDSAQIDSGYWDLGYPNVTGSLAGLQHPGTPPTNPNIVPAIKVSVKMDSVINNPVNTFFMRALGALSYNMAATAVAVAPSTPSCIGQGVVLPFAMNKCAYDRFWDSSTNAPRLVPAGTTVLPGYPYNNRGVTVANTCPDNHITCGPIETPGTPWIFWLTSGYHADHTAGNTCESGQWTSLSIQDNSAGAIRNIIDNFGQSNNITLCTDGTGVNDQIWISNGTMSTEYDSRTQPSMQTCASIPAGQAGSCAYALVPVINDNPINAGSWADIAAFACVHIIEARGGPDFYISVQMVAENDPIYGKYCVAPNSGGGGGVNYGATQPPVLVNYFGNTY